MYTQRRLTQLYIYLSLATGFGLPDHLQTFVLYTKSIYNWQKTYALLLKYTVTKLQHHIDTIPGMGSHVHKRGIR